MSTFSAPAVRPTPLGADAGPAMAPTFIEAASAGGAAGLWAVTFEPREVSA